MTAQLERLVQDANELDTYMNKIKKKGKTDLLGKLNIKKQFLTRTIAEFKQLEMQQEIKRSASYDQLTILRISNAHLYYEEY